MKPIYTQNITIDTCGVDRYGRLKPSWLLYYIQEVSTLHGSAMGVGCNALAEKNLFWAVLRTRVQITRLPHVGETIRMETWPMPTTKAAYPRSVIAYDSENNEIFRAISLWVLMDQNTRLMVLPSKSGFALDGLLTGSELATPASLPPRVLESTTQRTVCFSDLDQNGHMNNTRYFDWIYDLLPSSFHESHTPTELTICYLSEALEGEKLSMNWDVREDVMQVEATRPEDTGNHHRVFAARIQF